LDFACTGERAQVTHSSRGENSRLEKTCKQLRFRKWQRKH